MLALIDAGGEIKRSTDAFRRRHPGTTVPSGQWNTCERVLSGHARRAVVDIDGVEAAVEAVTDHRGLRHLLLSLPAVAVDAGGALLEQGVADSEAIVYLKDLSGRYLCINKLYAEFLYTTEDRVVGRSDPELERRETIDGPRLRAGEDAVQEPLQLEYIVPAFEGRPSFAVLRFAVRDRDGLAVGVCGVAAPTAEAQLARSECARLMQLERWSRLDADTIEQELWREWGIARVAADEPEPRQEESRVDAGLASVIADRDSALSASAALEHEMDRARRQIATLHDASATAARRADELLSELSAAQHRNEELEAQLVHAQHQLADAAGMHRADESEQLRRQLEEALAEAGAARGELERVRGEAVQATGELGRSRAQADEARAELQQALAHNHRLEADLEELRGRTERADQAASRALKEAQRAAEDARADAEQAGAELEGQRGELERSRGEVERSRGEVEQAHAELQQAVARNHQFELDLEELHGRTENADHDATRLSEEARKVADDARAELQQALAHNHRLEADLEELRRQPDGAADERELALERACQAEAELQATRIRLAEAATATAQLESQRDEERDDKAAVAAALNAERELGQSLRVELAAIREQVDATRRAEEAPIGLPPQLEESPLQWSSAAQHAFAAALAGASEWRVGLKDVVKVLGAEGGWDAVTAWSPDDGGLLRCSAMWTADRDLRALETLTWQRPQRMAGTALGEALYSPHPVWLTESKRRDDERVRAITAHEMRSALLVPIRDGIAPIGMLEFLTRTQVSLDADLSKSLEAVALQLGHFAHLLRMGAKPHWRLGRL